MALVEETLFGTVDKVHDSIERLRAFEPKDRPYWLAFSGGKDSVVILELAKMAGVNFEAHYSVTSVDPPELVRFIRKNFPEVSFDIPHDKKGKPITMWSLIKNNTMPPTQFFRYCCRELKESAGKGTVTVTGVRWAESVNRKKNQGVVKIQGKNPEEVSEVQQTSYVKTKQGGVVLNDDNDEARRAVEVCYRTRKTLVNPIIDWEDEDVWEFIRTRNLPYCELYDQGETRLGCIGCPMGGPKGMKKDFEKYPKYKAQYLRCFDALLERRKKRGLESKFDWKTGQDVYNWWIREDASAKPSEEELSLLEEETGN